MFCTSIIAIAGDRFRMVYIANIMSHEFPCPLDELLAMKSWMVFSGCN